MAEQVFGGGKATNRFVLSTDGTQESFLMDSTSKSLLVKVQTSGDLSGTNSLVDVLKPNVADDSLYVGDHSTSTIHEVDQLGNVISSFSSPSSKPSGAGFDSTNSIWISDRDAAKIYEVDKNGNIQSSFTAVSGATPRGVGVDSNDCIWNADSGNNSIYQYNQTGSVVTKFASPSNGPVGMAVEDGTGCLWTPDFNSENISKLDQTGVEQKSFSSPINPGSGGERDIAEDDSGSLWLVHEDVGGPNDKIGKLDKSGSLITSFASPDSDPNALGIDEIISSSTVVSTFSSNSVILDSDRSGQSLVASAVGSKVFAGHVSGQSLWTTDGNGTALKIDRTGSIITSFVAAPDTGGIDLEQDSGCVWVSKPGSSDEIHKVDQTGSLITSFAAPSLAVGGLDHDKDTGCLWIVDNGSVYKLDQTGAEQSQIPVPSGVPQGLDVDQTNECIWLCESTNTDKFFKIDRSGSLVTSFAAPNTDPQSVDVDESDGCLWHIDDANKSLYRMDQTGTVQSQFAIASTWKGLDVQDENFVTPASNISRFELNFQT